MGFEIVDVTEVLLPQIIEIERESFSSPWTAEQLKTQLKRPGSEFIAGLSADGAVLGYVGMAYVLDEGYISNVAVRKDCRQQSVGEHLVAALLERALALELSFVTLEVRDSNLPARLLYGKLGFKPVGLRRDYYVKPKEDAVLMTYFFESRQIN